MTITQRRVVGIGGAILIFLAAAYYFQPGILGIKPEPKLVPLTEYEVCQGEHCIGVNAYTISQGCLIEIENEGRLKGQAACGHFIVRQLVK